MLKLKRFFNQKGQADLVGNLFELLKTQPYLLPLLFLALIYTTTLTYNFAGVEISLFQPLNSLLSFISGSFGFFFDWRLFVIMAFLIVPVLFIVKYGKW